MKLTAEMRYPADPNQVYLMLRDPAFQERVCLASDPVSHRVDVVDGDGDGATITTSRELPTDEFPGLIRKFVGATVEVVRVDTWGPAASDGSRSGTLAVDIKGAPIGLTGTITLAPSQGGGSVVEIHGNLKASVPLIGGKIEGAVEPPIRASILQEEEIGKSWLAGAGQDQI